MPALKESGTYDHFLDILSSGNAFETESAQNHPVKGVIHFIIKSFWVGEGLGIIMHDITEQKLMEDALCDSEERSLSFIEQTAEGVAITDENGALIEWNKANERMIGNSLQTGEAVFSNYTEYEFIILSGERWVTRQSIFSIKTLRC